MKRSGFIYFMCALIIAAVLVLAVVVALIGAKILNGDKNTLVISSASISAVYDGAPLSDPSWTLDEGALKDGHSLKVTVSGSQTNVGTSENFVKAKIVDKDGADVTAEYNLTYRPGNIEVKPRPINIIVASDIKEYDGTPLTCDAFSVESPLSLLQGDVIDATIKGSITEVGVVDNVLDNATIKNKSGMDVTGNYEITSTPGTLAVYEEGTLVFESGSASHPYTGEPFTYRVWEMTSGVLETGDEPVVIVSGEQTEVGSSPNTISAIIVDSNGNDVSYKYDILCVPGVLTIVEPFDGSGDYAGGGGGGGGGAGGGGGGGTQLGLPEDVDMEDLSDIVLFVVTSDVTDSVYLRSRSYGSYTGNGWNEAEEYSLSYNSEFFSYYLTAYALEAAGVAPSAMKIEAKNGQFVLPYYTKNELVAVQKSDVFCKGNAIQPYNLMYYTQSSLDTGLTLPEEYRAFEQEYAAFVHDQYLEIDTATMNYMRNIIVECDFNANDPQILQKVATYIQNAATYDLEYNRALDEANNVVIAFLETYKTGICQHYASAATMLFRALGLPARYTVGYVGDTVSGTPVEITADKGHAWVEVYIDGLGWVSVEVTGSSSGGPDDGDSGGTGKELFVVTSNDKENFYLKVKSYGNLGADNAWQNAPVYDKLVNGNYSAYYLTTFAAKNGGLSTSSVSITPLGAYYALPYYTLSAGGSQKNNDTAHIGSVISKYEVQYYNWDGTSGLIIPSSYSDFEQEYARFVAENYLYVDEGTRALLEEIIEDNNFRASDSAVINKVVNYLKTAAKYDDNYDKALDTEENMVYEFLTSYRRGSDEHFAAAATLLLRTIGIPARYTEGYFASVKTEGVSVVVTDKDARAWIEVYVGGIGWVYVDPAPQKLSSSEPIELRITPQTRAERYDPDIYNVNNPLVPNDKVSGFESLSQMGYTYEAVATGENYNLGITASTIKTFRIYDSFGDLVYDYESGVGSEFFKITFREGTLHLYLEKLGFESVSKEKTYDGTELAITKDDCRMISGVLPEGYEIHYNSFTSFTNVSRKSASFKVTIMKDGVDCTTHFSINYSYGSMQVTSRVIEIYADGATKPYDGRPLTCKQISYDPSTLAPGEVISSYTIRGSQTNIGYSSNVVTNVVIVNARGDNVTSNYTVKTYEGELRVTLP